MKIKQEIIDQIITHAKEDAPVEACGYIAAKDGIVDKLFRLANVDRAEDHYTLDPKEQFAIVKKVREEGGKISAVYHSHPASPARMSQEDIRLAYDPTISYVICSLLNEEPTVKSFKCKKGIVDNEIIEIVT